jgi:hypothetical protein
MSTQPEALRLADIIEQDPTTTWGYREASHAAAAELRRLHELNEELLKTLKWLDRWLGGKPMTECSSRILDSIKKAEGV